MGSVNPNYIQCRYFAAGSCKRYGCVFAHDQSALPGNICRYFLEGTCFFDDKCRFDHVSMEDCYPSWYTADVPIDTENAENTDTADASASAPQTAEATPSPLLQDPRMAFFQEVRRICAHSEDTDDACSSHTCPKPSGAPKEVLREKPSGTTVPTTIKSVHSIVKPARSKLCEFGVTGMCTLIDCVFRHGDQCDMCNCQVLDPLDPEQREAHATECLVRMEKDVETSFAIKDSSETQCSVCLEIVMKNPDEKRRRFGILDKCMHPFCFDCIMRWRKQSREAQPENVLRSCPQCRTHSDYVVSANFFPKTPEEKEKVIKEFKEAMGKRSCWRYKQGKERCPFGNQCWYRHTKPDGTIVQLGPPRKRRQFVELPDVAFELIETENGVFEMVFNDDLSDSDDDLHWGDTSDDEPMDHPEDQDDNPPMEMNDEDDALHHDLMSNGNQIEHTEYMQVYLGNKDGDEANL